MLQPERTQREQRHIPTLDGWRALAILAVIVAHAGMTFYNRIDYYAHPVRFGVIGVDVFFGLSGLLITKLLLEEAERTGRIHLTGFYIRRAFRILPPCLVYIAVCVSLGLLQNRLELASSLLFFRNYLPDHIGSNYSAHLWSLAIEEHFYLFWPGLLVLAGISRGPMVAASLALACVAWRWADWHFLLFARVFPDAPVAARTDLRIDALLWGCVVAFALQHPATRAWLRAHYRISLWLLTAVVFIVCVVWHPPLATVWIAMLIPIMMAGTVLHPNWAFSRFLDWAPLRWIGRISYSLYLWQQIFLTAAWASSTPLGIVQRWPVSLLASFACATLSYYILERPLLRVGHQLASRTSERQPQLAAAGARA